MKKKLLIGAALILSVGMACTSGAGDWQSYSGDKRIEERVDSVLALMTLEEENRSDDPIFCQERYCDRSASKYGH